MGGGRAPISPPPPPGYASAIYVLPRLRTNFGERAFSHAGPSSWNGLPEDIRAEPNIAKFRKLVKLTILILCLTFNNYIL